MLKKYLKLQSMHTKTFRKVASKGEKNTIIFQTSWPWKTCWIITDALSLPPPGSSCCTSGCLRTCPAPDPEAWGRPTNWKTHAHGPEGPGFSAGNTQHWKGDWQSCQGALEPAAKPVKWTWLCLGFHRPSLCSMFQTSETTDPLTPPSLGSHRTTDLHNQGTQTPGRLLFVGSHQKATCSLLPFKVFLCTWDYQTVKSNAHKLEMPGIFPAFGQKDTASGYVSFNAVFPRHPPHSRMDSK